MEKIKCPNHPDSFCLLKTGTKPGPSHGISFYVCTHCKFFKQSTQSQMSCSIHDKTLELQSFVVKKDGKGIRQYFRCNGRDDGKSWCGYKQVSEDMADSSSKKTDKLEKSAEQVKEKKVESVDRKEESSRDMDELSKGKENVGENPNKVGDANTDGHLGKADQAKKHIPKQPLTFSDLSKHTKMSSASTSSQDDKTPVTPFQNKSFHHYRDSPDPSKRPGTKPVHRQRRDSNSSGSDCDDNIIQDTKDLMKGLTIKDDDDVKTKAIVGANLHKVSASGGNSTDSRLSKAELEAKTTATVSDIKRGKEECDRKVAGDSTQHQTIIGSHIDVEVRKNSDVDARVLFRNLREDRTITVLELEKLQNSLRAIRLPSLPDKGQKLLSKVSSYKQHIASLDSQMVALLREHGNSVSKAPDLPLTVPQQPQTVRVYPGVGSSVNSVIVKSQQVAVPGSSETQNASSDGNPGGTQFIQLPSHLAQYYAANPQAMTLYGGRMTAQRLREVGSITTEAIDKIHKQLESCPSESTHMADPPGLRVTLMPHQQQALAWLEWREQQHPAGGILADDMGLGKTLTMISHIMRKKQDKESVSAKEGWLGKDKQAHKAIKKSRGTLIVAPASLVHQWAKEIEKRCTPNCLKFLVYHGPNRENNINRLSDNDVVITTYAIVSKEIGCGGGDAEKGVKDDDDEEEKGEDEKAKSQSVPLLLRIGWERVILDEAHDIKNHKSARSQSVCRLRAAFRWALTGTPIQNDLKDMYSLLRFLRFSPFDELKVWKRHIESAKVSTKRLNTLVKALLLRRTKDQTTLSGKPLVELPNKTYENVEVELSEEEKKIYDKVFQKTQTTVQAYVHRHQDSNHNTNPSQPPSVSHSTSHYSGGAFTSGRGEGSDGGINDGSMNKPKNTGSQILVFLLRLRQCCSHLSLLKSHLESESLETDGIDLSLQEQMKGLALDEEGVEGGEAGSPVSSQTSSTLFEVSTLSTKLSHVMSKILTLKEEKPTDKSVIVSQWTAMLEIVAHHLKKSNIVYSLIQGNVPSKKRAEIVEDFNRTGAGAKVLLVSLCAGGVGLNLIGGNHLFLLDSHWNPALEAQACDRIYRIGQTKDVKIYRFICKKTIEEKIWVLQQGKLSLAKSVLSGTANKNQKLSLDDLRMLFGV